MQDKEKLKKLLDILEELLKIEGNEWLIDAILEKIKQVSSIEEIAKHSVIQDIHEHCIEKVIIKQANDFYKDFKIEGIKHQLIQDYKKMEHDRRRYDFEGFCLSMFQQLESIVNFCFKSKTHIEYLKINKNKPAFVEWNYITKEWERKSVQLLIPFLLIIVNSKRNENGEPFYKMREEDIDNYFDSNGHPIVDYIPQKRSWGFLHRFRSILFFYYFNQECKRNEFDKIYKLGNELYTMRNQNHRESKATPRQQIIINNIKGKESKYFFRFYGLLEDFVSSINKNIKESNQLKNFKTIKVDTKNTIGASNPELREIYTKMNKNNK